MMLPRSVFSRHETSGEGQGIVAKRNKFQGIFIQRCAAKPDKNISWAAAGRMKIRGPLAKGQDFKRVALD
jgi:hypothetical protein